MSRVRQAWKCPGWVTSLESKLLTQGAQQRRMLAGRVDAIVTLDVPSLRFLPQTLMEVSSKHPEKWQPVLKRSAVVAMALGPMDI